MDLNYILDDFLMERSTVDRGDIVSVKELDAGRFLIQTNSQGFFEYNYYSKTVLQRKTLDEIKAFHTGHDEKSFAEELGRRILYKLNEKNMNVAKLSDVCAISSSQLYNYINGVTMPSAYKMALIEKHLGCKPGYLNPFNIKI